MKYLLVIAIVALAANACIADDAKIKELLKRGQELLNDANEAINILHRSKREFEAKRLEEDVPALKKLMEQIQNEKNKDKLHILENELRLMEEKMAIEIKMAHFDIPDQREKLLEHARQLVKKAEQAEKYLIEQNREDTDVARRIAKHKVELKNLIKQIENENNMQKMISLESQMIHLEIELDKDIDAVYHPKKIELSYEIDAEIDVETLRQQVAKLDEQIKEDIKKLESEGHQLYTQNLVHIENHVVELKQKLEKMGNRTNGPELMRCEQEYLMLRGQYHHERTSMQRLIHDVDELEKHATELLTKIKTAIEKCQQKNMTADIEDLQADSDLIQVLVKDMKKDTTVDALRHAALILRGIEMSVDRKLHEIERKLNPHH